MTDKFDSLLPLILVGIGAAAALFVFLAKNPLRGIYFYLFSCAILLAPELPVVREKLTGAEAVFAATLLALICFSGRIRRGPAPLLPIQRTVLIAAGCWVASVFASLVANYLAGSLVSVGRSGLEAATYAYGFVVSFVIVHYVDTWEKWRTCLLAWTLGGGVVTAVGLMAMSIYSPAWTKDDFSGRISSTLRESNQVASYLGPLLPVAAFVLRSPGPSRLWSSWAARTAGFCLLAGAFVVMLGTGSRTAFLITGAAFAALMVLLFVVAPKERVKAGVTRFLAVGGLAAMIWFVYGVATDTGERYALGVTKPWERPVRIFAEILRGERDATDTRVEQVARLSRTWTDRPVFGAGPGNYSPLTRGHEIHNSYLNILAELGLVGVTAFGFWMLTAVGLARTSAAIAPRGEARVIVYGFLAGCVLLLLYQITILGMRQRPLWFVNGLLICLPRVLLDLHLRQSTDRDAASDPPSPSPPGAYSV
ncbi:O-antigen ligase family protein [Alienimonas sp. DA493]|uniref:O-antigen ligase family protein n=1 Tax=Alienimonas sp. DA493 TaxID=3373605 RepID=UPI00375422C6